MFKIIFSIAVIYVCYKMIQRVNNYYSPQPKKPIKRTLMEEAHHNPDLKFEVESKNSNS